MAAEYGVAALLCSVAGGVSLDAALSSVVAFALDVASSLMTLLAAAEVVDTVGLEKATSVEAAVSYSG